MGQETHIHPCAKGCKARRGQPGYAACGADQDAPPPVVNKRTGPLLAFSAKTKRPVEARLIA
jgi:hypothetical protein